MEAAELERIIHKAAEGEAYGAADLAVLAEAERAYPCAPLFAILRLWGDPDLADDERDRLRRKVALAVDDPRSIDLLRGQQWAQFYPSQPEDEGDPGAATDDAIDLFLNTYGHRSADEDAALERMIFNPIPDYAEMLAREEQEDLPEEPADPDSPEGRIDAFILSRHPAAHESEPEKPAVDPEAPPIHKPAKENASDTLLSESLARVYVKQGKYERAYDIILGLSRKYPRKNSYFNAQLSFLSKLMKCTKA